MAAAGCNGNNAYPCYVFCCADIQDKIKADYRNDFLNHRLHRFFSV
jgi:hypothetical protein